LKKHSIKALSLFSSLIDLPRWIKERIVLEKQGDWKRVNWEIMERQFSFPVLTLCRYFANLGESVKWLFECWRVLFA
jgi:hypothetical protein